MLLRKNYIKKYCKLYKYSKVKKIFFCVFFDYKPKVQTSI